MKQIGQFIKDNFYVLLMSALFVFTYLFWYYNKNPDMAGALKDINNGVFYGLLALIGVRPLTRPVAPTIQASTQTGDIIGGPQGDTNEAAPTPSEIPTPSENTEPENPEGKKENGFH